MASDVKKGRAMHAHNEKYLAILSFAVFVSGCATNPEMYSDRVNPNLKNGQPSFELTGEDNPENFDDTTTSAIVGWARKWSTSDDPNDQKRMFFMDPYEDHFDRCVSRATYTGYVIHSTPSCKVVSRLLYDHDAPLTAAKIELYACLISQHNEYVDCLIFMDMLENDKVRTYFGISNDFDIVKEYCSDEYHDEVGKNYSHLVCSWAIAKYAFKLSGYHYNSYLSGIPSVRESLPHTMPEKWTEQQGRDVESWLGFACEESGDIRDEDCQFLISVYGVKLDAQKLANIGDQIRVQNKESFAAYKSNQRDEDQQIIQQIQADKQQHDDTTQGIISGLNNLNAQVQSQSQTQQLNDIQTGITRQNAQRPSNHQSTITGRPQQEPLTNSTGYSADRHYNGANAKWVNYLLERAPNWHCPTSRDAKVEFKPDDALNCQRDIYVDTALREAYTAECESRLGNDEAAASAVQSMMENLRSAQALCCYSGQAGCGVQIGKPAICPTVEIVSCDALRPLAP